MTRDEAKAKLNEVIEWSKLNRYPYVDDREVEAIKVAIKALEQQACGDAVSREAVLGLFAQNADATRPYNTAWEEVKALPPVNPQPKTGHWIADVDKWGDIVTTVNGYKCSECGEFNADKDNYCPNCGAKMVEPQEGEDKE